MGMQSNWFVAVESGFRWIPNIRCNVAKRGVITLFVWMLGGFAVLNGEQFPSLDQLSRKENQPRIEKCRVLSVRLVMYYVGTEDGKARTVFWTPIAAKQKVEKVDIGEIKDVRILNICDYGLRCATRGAVFDKDDSVSGSAYLVGMLSITTEKEKLEVGISNVGFTFDGSQPTSDKLVFSWCLAKALNEIVETETGGAIPEGVFNNLSGQSRLAIEQRFFEKMRVKNH